MKASVSYHKQWAQNHRENVRRNWRAWAKRNVAKIKIKSRLRYVAKQLHILAVNALWRQRNPEKMADLKRRWNIDHRGLQRAQIVRRRARKRLASLPGSQWQISEIYRRAEQWRKWGFDVQVDHIFPLGFGWHEPANLQIIYADENRAKHANIDFTPRIIFL